MNEKVDTYFIPGTSTKSGLLVIEALVTIDRPFDRFLNLIDKLCFTEQKLKKVD